MFDKSRLFKRILKETRWHFEETAIAKIWKPMLERKVKGGKENKQRIRAGVQRGVHGSRQFLRSMVRIRFSYRMLY
jgi:hypothetical protein